jgi:hypothetical protein
VIFLVAVLVWLVLAVFIAWAAYDSGYGDGWLDHSEGRTHRSLFGRRKQGQQ